MLSHKSLNFLHFFSFFSFCSSDWTIFNDLILVYRFLFRWMQIFKFNYYILQLHNFCFIHLFFSLSLLKFSLVLEFISWHHLYNNYFELLVRQFMYLSFIMFVLWRLILSHLFILCFFTFLDSLCWNMYIRKKQPPLSFFPDCPHT